MTKHNKDFPVPPLTSRIMRNMQVGDTIYVDAGHKVRTKANLFQNQVNVSARAKQLGMTVSTQVLHLVDAKNHKMTTVVAIHCTEAAKPPAKKGRKLGGKNRVKQTEEVTQPSPV